MKIILHLKENTYVHYIKLNYIWFYMYSFNSYEINICEEPIIFIKPKRNPLKILFLGN